jgi:hypothetical protein
MTTFRTAGPWGSGSSGDLAPVDVDANFYGHEQRITALEGLNIGKSIASVSISGNVLTFTYTDATTSTVVLPLVTWNWTGAWQPNHPYAVMDTFSENGAVYAVVFPHTSAATFDPGANDGGGHNYYAEMLAYPSLSIPAGGAAATALFKHSSSDFDMVWRAITLGDLGGIVITSPTAGQVMRYSGTNWVNSTLPFPAPTVPGAVLQHDAVASQFLTSINVDGTSTGAQPAFTDISGVAGPSQLPTLDQVTGFLAPVQDPTLKYQAVTQSGGTLTINLANGPCVQTTLTGNISAISISGWLASGFMSKFLFKIINPSTYTVSGWPAGFKWPGGGTPPTITPNGTDVYIAFSYDGGTTAIAAAVGQNFL